MWLPGVSCVSNSDLPSPKCTQDGVPFTMVWPDWQTLLIDPDVIVCDARSCGGQFAGRHGGDLDSLRAEPHMQRALHGRAGRRFDEEYAETPGWRCRRR